MACDRGHNIKGQFFTALGLERLWKTKVKGQTCVILAVHKKRKKALSVQESSFPLFIEEVS